MIYFWRTMIVAGVISTASFATIPGDFRTPFASPEHVTIGNNVKLRLSEMESASTPRLHLPNGLQLTYGEILALADYYGDPDKPISLGQDKEEQEVRFLNAFKAFSLNADSINETNAILEVTRAEYQYIADGLMNGESEEDLYEKAGLEFDRQYNCATGGGCAKGTWWTMPGRSLLLLRQNYDHFDKNAILTYNVGHKLAIKEAIAAHFAHDPQRLEVAYAINAFACHFLSDRFSTGHMRVPRQELAEQVTPSTIGSLLASYMHSEESAYGLHVHNQKGEKWMAFGDKSYYSDKSKVHRKKQMEALQRSADEIYNAYQSGIDTADATVEQLIPYPDDLKISTYDIAPLFYWDQNTSKLMRRENLKEVYDSNWTDNWWGWSTLAALYEGKPIPLFTQYILAQSESRQEALNAGLITNKDVINYVHTLK